MHKLTALLVAALMTTASQANPNHHYTHRGHGGHYNWVAPIVIGSVLGYAVAQRPQPVVVQQPPIVYYPNMAPLPPVGYHYENILDANCNCYRMVLVQNQP